jgi:hypothetical protein
MGSRSISSSVTAVTIPASGSVAISKPGTLFIGSGGDLRCELANSAEIVTFKNLLGGTSFPYVVSRIYKTGTTVDNVLVAND